MKTKSTHQILRNQRDYFNLGNTKDIKIRISNLRKLKKAINDFEEKICEALKKDLGKSKTDAFATEVHEVTREIDYAIKNLKSWAAKKRVPTPITLKPASSFIKKEPLGVVLVIGAWNYPFGLSMAPVVASMAAGNTTIIKPSEMSPHTEHVIEEMVQANFDEDYMAVVTGGIPETTQLLKESFDHIFFTGSGEIGKVVMTAAAKHLTPVTLELGGKSPCIIDDNIDIATTAKRIIWGKTTNAGQTCVAPDYLLVKEDIRDKLLDEMKKTIIDFYGPNIKESPQYGKIISKKHVKRLRSYLKDGKIYTGGEVDEEKRFISPTILTDVSPESTIMNEEIFGPILPVLPYKHLHDAIDFVNKRPKPLALYLFSRDKNFIDKVLNNTSSGGACVNDVILHITSNHLPFGGVGPSGMGSYHGKAGFDRLSHSKSVLKKPFFLDQFLRYAPNHKMFYKILKFI